MRLAKARTADLVWLSDEPWAAGGRGGAGGRPLIASGMLHVAGRWRDVPAEDGAATTADHRSDTLGRPAAVHLTPGDGGDVRAAPAVQAFARDQAPAAAPAAMVACRC